VNRNKNHWVSLNLVAETFDKTTISTCEFFNYDSMDFAKLNLHPQEFSETVALRTCNVLALKLVSGAIFDKDTECILLVLMSLGEKSDTSKILISDIGTETISVLKTIKEIIGVKFMFSKNEANDKHYNLKRKRLDKYRRQEIEREREQENENGTMSEDPNQEDIDSDDEMEEDRIEKAKRLERGEKKVN